MKFWPCDYRIQTPQGHQQCVNAPCGHPHHQSGKAVKPGYHLTRYQLWVLQDEFRNRVERTFDKLKSRLKYLSDSHEQLKEASMIHLGQTRMFYQSIGGIDKLVSHLTCLVCLAGVPEHSLPCGHVICRECAKAAGDTTPGGFVKLEECPLPNHHEEDWPRGLAKNCKSSKVGIGTLSLHGYGSNFEQASKPPRPDTDQILPRLDIWDRLRYKEYGARYFH